MKTHATLLQLTLREESVKNDIIAIHKPRALRIRQESKMKKRLAVISLQILFILSASMYSATCAQSPWTYTRGPTIGSCDSTGVQKDVFNSNETVYVIGGGYAPSQTYNIYIVNDTAWFDAMTIPARIQGTVTSVSSDPSGNINLTAVWNKSLTLGEYDLLVDVDSNGKYDAYVDALYENKIVITSGFSLIPEYLFGTILGLASCFAALGAFRLYKRKRR